MDFLSFLLTKLHCLHFLTSHHPSAQCTLALPQLLHLDGPHCGHQWPPVVKFKVIHSPHLPGPLSFHDPALYWLPSAALATLLRSPMWACLLSLP